MEGRDEAFGRVGGAFPRIWPMAAGVDELQRLGEDLVATSIDCGRERQGVDGGPSASGCSPALASRSGAGGGTPRLPRGRPGATGQ